MKYELQKYLITFLKNAEFLNTAVCEISQSELQTLQKVNDKVYFCTFGQTDVMKNKPCQDVIITAKGGVAAVYKVKDSDVTIYMQILVENDTDIKQVLSTASDFLVYCTALPF